MLQEKQCSGLFSFFLNKPPPKKNNKIKKNLPVFLTYFPSGEYTEMFNLPDIFFLLFILLNICILKWKCVLLEQV